jgi:hypothetical protein
MKSYLNILIQKYHETKDLKLFLTFITSLDKLDKFNH